MQSIQESQTTNPDGSGSVIIQMGAPPESAMDFAHSASGILRQRALALTARDCLPVDRNPQHSVTVATPRPLLRADAEALKGSLLVRTAAIPSVPAKELRQHAADRLQPLLDQGIVQDALAAKGRDPDDAVKDLWTSGALALDLSAEDQDALRETVPGISGIYRNRHLQVPPVVEVLNVPEEVRETRASSWGLKTIGALASWAVHGNRGEGVRVAVLDTGVDADHPDLTGKVDAWAEFDHDGHEIQSSPHDDHKHGTHVAGTIVGGDASGQWIGVAPDARLCCAKVLGPEGGTDAQILAGMRWAIDRKVDVISMSLGGLTLGPEMLPTYTEVIIAALQQGIPVVIAIGNDGSQTSGCPGNDLFALAVGATDVRDRPAGFSGGRTQIVSRSAFIDPKYLPLPYSKPDVAAPGVAVVSSVPGGKWEALNGTSMATPHVAGALALLLGATKIRDQVSPEERASILSDVLTGSVEELGEAGQDHRYGFGRVDVLRAIDFANERGY